jgi:hypothetical protein
MQSQRFEIRPDYMPMPLFFDPVLDSFPLFSGGETGNSRKWNWGWIAGGKGRTNGGAATIAKHEWQPPSM